MRVGSAAHTHVERFTCVSRGLRAHSRVNVRHSGLTCEPTTWLLGCEHSSHVVADVYASSLYPRVAQNADRLTPNSPISPFFAEVVCVLGATPVRQPAGRGELRHARVRHAGDTPTQRLAWRKTPTPSPASGTTAPDREARSPRNSGRVRHQLTMVRPNSEPPKAREHRRPRGNVLSTARTPNGSTRGATV